MNINIIFIISKRPKTKQKMFRLTRPTWTICPDLKHFFFYFSPKNIFLENWKVCNGLIFFISCLLKIPLTKIVILSNKGNRRARKQTNKQINKRTNIQAHKQTHKQTFSVYSHQNQVYPVILPLHSCLEVLSGLKLPGTIKPYIQELPSVFS